MIKEKIKTPVSAVFRNAYLFDVTKDIDEQLRIEKWNLKISQIEK